MAEAGGCEDAPAKTRSLDDFKDSESMRNTPLKYLEALSGNVHWTQRIVLRKNNPVRFMWGILTTLLVVYIGTVYIYCLAFIDYRILDAASRSSGHRWSFDSGDSGGSQSPTFHVVAEEVIDVVFWIDLFLCFLFSYEDVHGDEVTDLKRMTLHYLRSDFALNLLSCSPSLILGLMSMTVSTSIVRVVRLYRLCRGANIGSFLRILNLDGAISNTVLQKMVTFTSLAVRLVWLVHILACGLYLCASFHEDPNQTWVARRELSDDKSLLDESPIVQWMHAMYFVLTVFTTVGFGDISALTTGEIAYACFTMIVGAIAHSIIISEVIGLVTTNDRVEQFREKKVNLINAFCQHVRLDRHSKNKMKSYIALNAPAWMDEDYDKSEMQEILFGKYFSREMLNDLPPRLFEGKLVNNTMLKPPGDSKLSPRLPVLLALLSHKAQYQVGDVIYAMCEYPSNMFIVLDGVFSYVSRDAANASSSSLPEDRSRLSPALGGNTSSAEKRDSWSHPDDILVSGSPYMLFTTGTYFGDLEVMGGGVRRATARCERSGSVLTLHKTHIKEIQEEFPSFVKKWKMDTIVREVRRRKKEACLNKARHFEELAAMTIQNVFLAKGLRGRSLSSNLEERRGQSMEGETENRSRLEGRMRAASSPAVASTSAVDKSASGNRVTVDAALLKSIKQDQDQLRSDLRSVQGTMESLHDNVALILRNMSLLDSSTTSV